MRSITPASLVDVNAHAIKESTAQRFARWAHCASIEINVHDVPHLAVSTTLLAPGNKIYVSHLPKQSWRETVTACAAVRAAGFDPVPHVPVRLLDSVLTLDDLLKDFIDQANVREVLLIAGDYPTSRGPFTAVKQVLATGLLNEHRMTRVSLAGHPEGHPKIDLTELRSSEREKCALAAEAGLSVTLLSQFCFEPQPLIEWANELRAQGVTARIVAGVCGPASAATLLRFAMRCGVGPSIRALGARPMSLLKLSGQSDHHGPEQVIRGIAAASAASGALFDGVHLFCFGGFLKTCRWLRSVAAGESHI